MTKKNDQHVVINQLLQRIKELENAHITETAFDTAILLAFLRGFGDRSEPYVSNLLRVSEKAYRWESREKKH